MNQGPTPAFENHLDRRIFQSIRGCTTSRPQTLAGIIGNVDASERLILSLEELSGGLERLCRTGQIVEVAQHRYAEAAGDATTAQTAITESEHVAAVAAYRATIQTTSVDDPSHEFVRERMAVRCTMPNGRWPSATDEDAVEELARSFDGALSRSGMGEVSGFESGSGHIDVLIFGRPDEADARSLRELVVAHVSGLEAPPGMTIRVIERD